MSNINSIDRSELLIKTIKDFKSNNTILEIRLSNGNKFTTDKYELIANNNILNITSTSMKVNYKLPVAEIIVINEINKPINYFK